MSKWDNFCAKVSKVTNKAVKETNRLADIASLKLKLNSIEVKKAEEFEKLGRLTYDQLRNGIERNDEGAESISEIDRLIKQYDEIQKEIDALKSKKEKSAEAQEKAEADTEPASAPKSEEEPQEATAEGEEK